MMKQRTGSIVNIASVVGVMGNAGQVNYSASKGGLLAMTRTLARSWAAAMCASTPWLGLYQHSHDETTAGSGEGSHVAQCAAWPSG